MAACRELRYCLGQTCCYDVSVPPIALQCPHPRSLPVNLLFFLFFVIAVYLLSYNRHANGAPSWALAAHRQGLIHLSSILAQASR